MKKLSISAGNTHFTASLADNPTAQAFRETLPQTVSMEDLHGNEKYYNFSRDFPTKFENVEKIEAGDLMLYGSNCIVLFYESFSTTYSYTRIAKIEQTEGLAQSLGDGRIEVIFELERN